MFAPKLLPRPVAVRTLLRGGVCSPARCLSSFVAGAGGSSTAATSAVHRRRALSSVATICVTTGLTVGGAPKAAAGGVHAAAFMSTATSSSSLLSSDATSPRLGLSAQANKESVERLQALLCDEFMLYVLLRNAHWAVRGKNFKDLHVLFEEQYQHSDGVFDEIAERIRTLGGAASITPHALESSSRLKSTPADFHTYKAQDIVRRVAEDTERLICSYRDAAKAIEKTGEDIGTVDYLCTTLREHEKNVWMVRAHLGE